MTHYECENCGYDMTGIEKFASTLNTLGYMPYDGYIGSEFPMALMSTATNTVRCPSCGNVGDWVKG